ncbi:TetR/AcrR family transcriptional regulator [Pseudomonas massiliensis]|uniref:TetR/AcrR family transcriptional regulator n=1 Tax=Pseudomonas massiliensis TaxID=522492 RepID=UPI00069332CF|nr:TetR/AcrR family transcriptional regulator [Pseudomonas massiliensis]
MAVKDSPASSAEQATPKRRRAPKGEQRRAALLDAATVMIARDGFQAASMRDIAELAGITTVGLLHHFPNKVALLRALLDRRDQRVVERFGDLLDAPTLEGFMRFLRMGMTFSVETRDECQAAVMINTESLSKNHPAWPWYREKFEMTHAHAQAHLQSLVERGEIRAGVDVRALAQEIFSVMDGLQIQWLRGPKDVKVLAVFDQYLQRLERDLRGPTDAQAPRPAPQGATQ